MTSKLKIFSLILITNLTFISGCGSGDGLNVDANVDSIHYSDKYSSLNFNSTKSLILNDSSKAFLNDSLSFGNSSLTSVEPDSTAENLEAYMEEQAAALKGKLVHNIPSQMNIDEVYSVFVSIKQDTNNLAERPDVASPDEEISATRLEKVLPFMRIELIDESTDSMDKNFKINPHNPTELQKLDKKEFSTWLFDIKALNKGKHKLKIQLGGCEDKDNCRFVSLEVIDIEIEASPIRPVIMFLKEYWWQILTGLIIPFGIWLFNEKRKKRK